MSAVHWLAPDFTALDTLWRHPLPFALWPVGRQSLLAHWMDEAVRENIDEVHIYASDRPAEIRQHLEGGGYWSKKVTVHPLQNDQAAPAHATVLDHFPGQEEWAAPSVDAQELLQRWLSMQRHWLVHRSAEKVSIDEQKMPGGWIGPLARVHPKAELHPPFWIGARTEVGPECRIGPNACVGEDCVLDSRVEIEDAVVLPGTFLGTNTRLNRALAQGGILVDVKRACRVDILENFIMSTVEAQEQSVGWLDQIVAFGLWILLAPAAMLWKGQTWKETELRDRTGETYLLRTGRSGPLLIRRWPWLREVARGRFAWFGILPRSENQWAYLPSETADRLKATDPGLFSWADLQGCHEVESPEEWIHAAYQVLHNDGTAHRLLRRQCWRLAFRSPA